MISNVGVVKRGFAKSDGKHGYVSLEFQMIESFFNGLVLINNGNIGDFIELMKLSNSVLNKFSEFDSIFHGV